MTIMRLIWWPVRIGIENARNFMRAVSAVAFAVVLLIGSAVTAEGPPTPDEYIAHVGGDAYCARGHQYCTPTPEVALARPPAPARTFS